MKREKRSGIFWAVFCAAGLLLTGNGCVSDYEQQQLEDFENEQFEEDQQDSELPVEYEISEQAGAMPAEPIPITANPIVDRGIPEHSLIQAAEPSVMGGMPVAEEPVNPQEPKSPPKEFIYNVIEGDWLSKIAGRVYGNAHQWKVIHLANPSIRNPDLIYPNDKIVIPITGPEAEAFARSYTGIGLIQPQTKGHLLPYGIGSSTRAVTPVSFAVSEAIATEGDSLSKIAEKGFKKAPIRQHTYKPNRKLIENPDMTFVEQVPDLPAYQVASKLPTDKSGRFPGLTRNRANISTS